VFEGTLPAALSVSRVLREINIAGNMLTGSIPSSVCQVTSLVLVELGAMDVCYPLCIQRQIRNTATGYNQTRCKDNNDEAFCAFVQQTNIASIFSATTSNEVVRYESSHPMTGE
jgi:hypothetical protein